MIETCPVCGVKIEDNAKVIFSYGSSGTKSRLWARVCQFAKNDDCINDFNEMADKIESSDYYK